jgi:6-phosphogluconolactonase
LAISDSCEGPNALSIPARMIQPTDGKLVWFLDEAAASSLMAKSNNFDNQGF